MKKIIILIVMALALVACNGVSTLEPSQLELGTLPIAKLIDEDDILTLEELTITWEGTLVTNDSSIPIAITGVLTNAFIGVGTLPTSGDISLELKSGGIITLISDITVLHPPSMPEIYDITFTGVNFNPTLYEDVVDVAIEVHRTFFEVDTAILSVSKPTFSGTVGTEAITHTVEDYTQPPPSHIAYEATAKEGSSIFSEPERIDISNDGVITIPAGDDTTPAGSKYRIWVLKVE